MRIISPGEAAARARLSDMSEEGGMKANSGKGVVGRRVRSVPQGVGRKYYPKSMFRVTVCACFFPIKTKAKQ